MAIVQISRIQHRRGRKLTGSGMPQLASGELGWAIDTQELFIGNGAVSEGAPAVGNTKLITEHDNLFDLAEQYAYKPDDSLWSTTTPIARSLQDRLDDFVTVASFGAYGDGSDQTSQIQNAIDSLYLNGVEKNRVVLYFPAGVYLLSQTIEVPPYATIVGAGKDKTIFRTSSGGFKTVNSSGDVDTTVPYTESNANQARDIEMRGFTLELSGEFAALDIVDCVYSTFKEIRLKGTWTTAGVADTLIGIQLSNRDESAGTVDIKKNIFEDIEIDGFHYAVYSNYDIRDNTWSLCDLYMCKFGFSFGENSNIGAPGQTTGPVFNTIEKCTFDMIDQYGILVGYGEYNTSKNNKFYGVGNDGGASSVAAWPVIEFTNGITNVSDMDYFERTQDLTNNNQFVTGADYNYVPEVNGRTLYRNQYANELYIGQQDFYIKFMKLPAIESGTIFVDYVYTEEQYSIVREGTLAITVNLQPADDADSKVTIEDDYRFSIRDPLDPTVYANALQFTATLENFGDYLAGEKETVSIEAINSAPVLNDRFTYTIRVKS